MALTGGVSFFKKSKCLFADGATATASSGEASIKFALSNSKIRVYRSVGSVDTITETIIVTLPAAVPISRILLNDFNFKEFTVKYESSGSFLDFTTVVGLDGALGGGISETTFSDVSAYYEFDTVTTDQLEITVTKTQVADQEKYLNQFIVTEELGTLEGYPELKNFEFDKNSRERGVLSGRSKVTKSEESFSGQFVFKNYPPSLSDDFDLMFLLWDGDDEFLVWPCGGRRGTDFFKYTLQAFGLKDIFQCQMSRKVKPNYSRNVYTNMINATYKVIEAV